jgi:plasmid stability protein
MRNAGEETVARLKARPVARGRSAVAEHREILCRRPEVDARAESRCRARRPRAATAPCRARLTPAAMAQRATGEER